MSNITTEPPSPLVSSSRHASDNVLEVEDLRVVFRTEEGEVRAVDGVSFHMRRGRILALVGESGCGKSVTSYSLLRLVQSPGEITGGRILFRPAGEGGGPPPAPVDIAALDQDDEELYRIRGGNISMIFQEPMTALSPVHRVGNQLVEAIRQHQPLDKKAARARAIDMLGKVGIPGPEKRVDQYPFELSGGMRQRVVIAMALVCDPEILIADEPTTALDVTIQAQIMGLIKDLQSEMNTSTLLITHDLGVVGQLADDVAVMYLGRIVERGDVRSLIHRPRHPYTMMLLRSLPGMARGKDRLSSIKGSVPSLMDVPAGCPFHPRCPFAVKGRCDQGGRPELAEASAGHGVACLRWDEIDAADLERADGEDGA